MIAYLPLNYDGDTIESLGIDISVAKNNFVAAEVEISRARRVELIAVGAKGTCFCSSADILPAFVASEMCDTPCNDDDDDRTCGSSLVPELLSVYQPRSINIRGLSATTEYSISASIIMSDGDDSMRTEESSFTTSAATVPGPITDLTFVEHFGNLIEVQWSNPDDEGGLPILNYTWFVNGFYAGQTDSGSIKTASIILPTTPEYIAVSVAAVNEVGSGPESFILAASGVFDDEPYPVSQLQVISVGGGSVVFRLDNTVTTAMATTSLGLFLEQRASFDSEFSSSVFEADSDGLVTVYKLSHDTLYIFRAYTAGKSAAAIKNGLIATTIVKTGAPTRPSKTPTPEPVASTGMHICNVDNILLQTY